MDSGETMVNGIGTADAEKFLTLFKLLDTDGSGSIGEQALANLMPRMGMFLSESELHVLFCHVDKDGSGGIDFHEFLELMSRHREASQLSLLEGGREGVNSNQRDVGYTALRSDDPSSWVFDCVIMCCIMFYVVVVTFEAIKHELFYDGSHYIKVPFGVIMCIDVVRGLVTRKTDTDSFAFVQEEGKAARMHYMRSLRFVLDVGAALPTDIVPQMMGEIGLMKVLQFTRLLKLFVYKDLFKQTPRDTLSPTYARFYFTYVPLCKMLFTAMTTVHILTMVWILLSNDPDMAYVDAAYFVMYTLTTTGYGDVPVEKQQQKWFCIFLFCCASVVSGLVVGKLVQFSQQADLQTDANKRMLETLAALNHLTIPRDFKEEVLGFQMHRLRHSNSLFNEAISGLPQVMQDRMALYARMKIVRQVPIFAEAQEICVAKLAQSLVNVFVPPEEYIVIAGEEGEEMFFLFHGMCEVTLPDGQQAATLMRGAVFGELALLQETRRSASIKSLTYCHLFRLDKVHHHHHLAS